MSFYKPEVDLVHVLHFLLTSAASWVWESHASASSVGANSESTSLWTVAAW